MQLDKRDLVTIAVLAVIFFSFASWNLGLTQAPLTTWQTSENKSFYIDLGEYENVNGVYLLVQRGNVTVNVYTGSPGNWSNKGEVVIQAFTTTGKKSMLTAIRSLCAWTSSLAFMIPDPSSIGLCLTLQMLYRRLS
jgi:hypothetical protein